MDSQKGRSKSIDLAENSVKTRDGRKQKKEKQMVIR